MAASSRQRAFFLEKYFRRYRINTKYYSPDQGGSKLELGLFYLRILIKVGPNDIIFCQRTVYNFPLSVLIISFVALFNRKLVFDFDDAIYLHAPITTTLFTKVARAVIVGSHSLYDWSVKHNKHVYIVPTCVDVEDYRVRKIRRNKTQVIGWNGSAPGQIENLRLLVPVFKKLLTQKLAFKVVLIGVVGRREVYDMFQSISGLEVTFIDRIAWEDPKVIASHLSKFDIGLNPLVDNELNRGKCAFKAIEYMATGVPTICSAVGENKYLIKNGENGFLVNDLNEWVEKIEQLANSDKLRKKLGKAGQKTVEDNYSYEAIIPKLVGILSNC